jgi:hypothetical protein
MSVSSGEKRTQEALGAAREVYGKQDNRSNYGLFTLAAARQATSLRLWMRTHCTARSRRAQTQVRDTSM